MNEQTSAKNMTRLAAFFFVLWTLTAGSVNAGDMPSPSSQSNAADKIVRQSIQAYGGKDALSRVKSLYLQGYQTSFLLENDGIVTYFLQRPLKLRIESDTKVSPGTRVLNETSVWTAGKGAALKKAEKIDRDALLFQYNYLDLPFALNENSATAAYAGNEGAGDKTADILQIKRAGGQDINAYVDRATGLISRVSGTISGGSGPINVSIELSEYRDVSGVKVPHRINVFYGSNRVGETIMSDVAVNKAMADTLFRP